MPPESVLIRFPVMDIFSNIVVEALARVLAEFVSGTEISRLLNNIHLKDNSLESTKWRRLDFVFRETQEQTRSSNQILRFTKEVLAPVRFGANKRYASQREAIDMVNKELIYVGLKFEEDLTIIEISVAKTQTEAQRRTATLTKTLRERGAHHEIFKYCKKDLLREDYFSALFEANKGLFERIRQLTGLQDDGACLIDKVFAIESGILAINSLQTETEKSEQKGVMNLLKGCAGVIRNPLAHTPKILWAGESGAVDYLMLISTMHKILDKAVRRDGRPFAAGFSS